MRKLPDILARRTLDYGGRFQIERIDLRFSNNAERTFERMVPRGQGAVVVAAMRDRGTLLLVREYACAVHRYELGLVKGRIDPGESLEVAAVRELKEEAGFGARRITVLREMTLVPAYMPYHSWLVLAEDLYPERLPGDEPEPMRVEQYPLSELSSLIQHPQFSEGRALAALYLARDLLTQRGEFGQ